MIGRALTAAAFALPVLGYLTPMAEAPTPAAVLDDRWRHLSPVITVIDPEPVTLADRADLADNQVEETLPPTPDQLPGRWLVVRATAYSPHDKADSAYHRSKGTRWRWIAADGKSDVRARPYGVAVSRGDLPYGTKVYIPAGQGYLDQTFPDPADRVFVVDDTGGAITSAARRTGRVHLDLRYRHEASARRFGARDIEVYVLEGP